MKKPKIDNIIKRGMFMILTLSFCAMVHGEEIAPIPQHNEPYVVESGMQKNLRKEATGDRYL